MLYQRKIFIYLFVFAGFVMLTAQSPSIAQDLNVTSQAVRTDISKTLDIEKKIQTREADWSDEFMILNDTLVRLEDQNKALEREANQLERLLALEERKHIENIRKRKEAERIRNELSTVLDSVLDKLEEQINHDLPFLTSERQARINSLKEMMVDPNESTAERFRRIFEALQIETEYGNTIEVTRETILFEGTQTLVNIFRLGRISLFCQTIDQEKSGYFDIIEQRWKLLPANVNRDLAKAIAIARMERSIELVKLPLGRIVRP